VSEHEERQLGLFGSPPADAPEMETGPPARLDRPELAADREARRLAQTEFARPLLVEAGAGTGKTTTLTARLLAWSLGPGWERAEERVRRREAERRPLAAPSDEAVTPDPEEVAAETLGGVVAITFTEVAAAGMARRAGETLAKLAGTEDDDGPPPWLVTDTLPAEPERSRRARALLGGLDHLVVRTIHAWCRSLLASHPLEAGLHPELEVDADGLLLEEIAREVVEARLAEGYGDPGDDDLLALAGDGIGPAHLVEAAVGLVTEGLRARHLEESPFSAERVACLAEALARACRELEEAAGGRLDTVSRSPKTGACLEALRATLGAAGAGEAEPADFDRLCAAVSESWKDNRDRLKKWGRGDFLKGEAAALGDAADGVARAAAALLARIDPLLRLDPARLEHARRALLPIVAEIRRTMRRRGVATFQDLLAEARDLLVGRPGVAARVRRRIDQLLVDELQDTDRLQCDVIAKIALDGAEGDRPGLFLVGDPKQSIYGWRNADLRAYEELWRRVEQAGGLRLTLAENFRSVPAILDEVTRSVSPVMIEHPGLQPRFEALVPCERLAQPSRSPGFSRGDWRAVEHWVSWRPDDGSGPALAKTRSGDATLLEADAIARDLARLHREEGLPWGRAALLLRAFSQLDDYLDAFRRHGVPFAVTGDRQYYRRREIIDTAALVRAVLDPGDHLALLTLLRSPAVGVPDAALVPLWLGGFPRRMTELVAPDGAALAELAEIVETAAGKLPAPESVPGLAEIAGWERVLVATVESLAHLRRSFAVDPADRFVEEIRRRIPVEPIAAARYLGRYRLANLERFFRRLVEAIESTEGDVDGVLRALRRGVAEALEEEEGRLQGTAEDAVQVMTIHKAKGLDFGHVYLPQLHKGSPRNEMPFVDAAPAISRSRQAEANGSEGASLAHLEGGRGIEGEGGDAMEYVLFGLPTPGYAAVADEAARVAAAERVRTLYVAMTRAEERMVLLGAWPESPGDSARGRSDGARGGPEEATSYLDLLGKRFEAVGSMADLWQAAEAAGGRLDRHGVRWVFPALVAAGPARGDEAGTAEPTRPALPSPDEVVAATERLRSLQRAAARRSARKVSAPASHEAHRLLEELLEARFEEAGGAADGRNEAMLREAAMAAGSAVHRVLEELDLAALADDAAGELARHRRRLDDLLRPYFPAMPGGGDGDGAVAEARRRVEEVLDRLEAAGEGGILSRLAALRDHLVARELPVLLPPSDPESAASRDGDEDAPVGFVSGALDLLYRDPATGRLVVADYKTDRVEAEDELSALADLAGAYAPQARLYARAVREALDLAEPPRAELWFLWPGRVVTVE
jgi:ATP-dependent helicase/nuclease subunit A